MINRLRITTNGAEFTATDLLWNFALKSQEFANGATVKRDGASMLGPRVSKLDEIIELITAVKANWSILNSDEILESLDRACKIDDEEKATEANFSDQPEIWLLKALALEKSLTSDIAEIEKYYSKCRGGLFQAVLVLNNCGVVQAKRQKCGEALELLKEAMLCSYKLNKYAKAPFFNFALVVEQLYKQRFIFDTKYLALLKEVGDKLPVLQDLKGSSQGPASEPSDTSAALSDGEIRHLYTGIARFAAEINESLDDKFYSTKLSYLVPEIDLLESFGYAADKVDREIASERYQQASDLFNQGKYAESIYAFDQASRWAPDYLKGASEEIEKVSSTWRHKEDQTILELTGKKEFDRAIRRLKNLPDPSLEREFDNGLIENLYKQKQISLLHQAEELVSVKDFEKAKLKYKQLLREDLADHLRKYVSSSLAELMDDDGPGTKENKSD